ncbi:MAG: ATP-binding cassette domain-containing protein [Actinophytocola sp.]|nr:ATP-binding cassette domain-containing protein [Actinophytocola sp.]
MMNRWVPVLDNVSLTVRPGHTVGLAGESGSGKSVTASTVLGLHRSAGGRATGGHVWFDGRDLLTLDDVELRGVRGARIGLILQQPQRSLDPAFTVGDQIAETIRAHFQVSRREAWGRAVTMLDEVGIPSAARRAHEYPHTFSGGMCQRVMIAIALAADPQILVADEPTTALDVTIQAQVLGLLKEQQAERGLGILFITHDLGVIAEMCDTMAVMYAGQVVEQGPAASVLRRPRHPYTHGLLAAMPRPAIRRLTPIAGRVPAPHEMPAACRFEPRCAFSTSACKATVPDLVIGSNESGVRCLRRDELTVVAR